MKEERDEKTGLACDRWEMIDEVASDLVRDSYSKQKSITWFFSLHEGDESTALLRDMNVAKNEETYAGVFSSYQEGEVWWQ